MTRECFWGECIGRQALRGTYIGCEHGIAGRRLVHGHWETEGAGPQAPMLQQWDPLGRGWRSGLRPGLGTRRAQGEGGREGTAHSKAHRRLQGSARPGLAADVVEGEQQVMVLCHAGWKMQLELLVEFRGPGRIRLGDLLGAGLPTVCPITSAMPHLHCCWASLSLLSASTSLISTLGASTSLLLPAPCLLIDAALYVYIRDILLSP